MPRGSLSGERYHHSAGHHKGDCNFADANEKQKNAQTNAQTEYALASGPRRVRCGIMHRQTKAQSIVKKRR